MKIIDANTGFAPKVGDTFVNVVGRHTLLDVEEGLLSARALFRTTYRSEGGDATLWGRTREIWIPLQVRYTHPGFFLQKVGFIPS